MESNDEEASAEINDLKITIKNLQNVFNKHADNETMQQKEQELLDLSEQNKLRFQKAIKEKNKATNDLIRLQTEIDNIKIDHEQKTNSLNKKIEDLHGRLEQKDHEAILEKQ